MLDQAALNLVDDIGRRLHQMTGEPRNKEYLLQRLQKLPIARVNAAAVLGTAGRRGERSAFVRLWIITLYK